MAGATALPQKAARYLKRLLLLPHMMAETTTRLRAVESALAAIEPPTRPSFVASSVHPELRSEHIAGATLYADRVQALDALPSGGRVAEIGVAVGDFSEVILQRLRPARFDAFDIFRLHHDEQLWGRPIAEWFGGRSHREHYESRFSQEIAAGTVQVHEGDSSAALAAQPDGIYDMVYIDGDHSTDGVRRDAEVAARKLKPGGTLVFNDYVMVDYATGDRYGVVPIVNDFCVNRGWKVVYVALHWELFCDIALQRRD